MLAVKAVLERISDLLRRRASEQEGEIDLRGVSLEQRPYRPPEPNMVLCVDIHENESALKNAIEYARQVYTPRPGKIKFIPSLFALVNLGRLSAQERRLVNKELIPAGASIFPYPAGCHSFPDAMEALRKQLNTAREQYDEARRHLETVPPRLALGAEGGAHGSTEAALASTATKPS